MKADPAALLLLTAVFSAACALVLALRPLARRMGGAGAAYGLWCLPPLMLLALAIPVPPDIVRPMRELGALPAAVLQAGAIHAEGHAAAGWIAVWLLGALACLGWQLARQYRFMRALGTLVHVPHPRLPLYRATHDAGLPALVGLWRPRIVLPPDFEARYAPAQRTLLLRHEQVHRRRGDLPCNALATLLLCLQWFNPMAHLALGVFRRDQEMACDARVLARRPRQRRAYAEAMLIGQAAAPLPPLGCPWPSRHPLKERIAMLRQPLPSPRRRFTAVLSIGLLAAGGGYAAWAAQPATPAKGAAVQPAHVPAAAGQAATQTLPPPRYPKDAYEKNLGGQVILRIDVRADGSVSNVVVESSRPAGVFDAVSVEAARQWRFRPEMKDGKPVAGRVRVPVTVEMNATPPPAGGSAVASR